MENVNINKKEVKEYFNTLITDKEIWTGDEKQNRTTAHMLHGALVFANIFGIITDDEMENYLNLEV